MILELLYIIVMITIYKCAKVEDIPKKIRKKVLEFIAIKKLNNVVEVKDLNKHNHSLKLELLDNMVSETEFKYEQKLTNCILQFMLDNNCNMIINRTQLQ